MNCRMHRGVALVAWTVLLAGVSRATAQPAAEAPGAPGAPGAPAQEVVIGSLTDVMKFDRDAFTVEAGRPVLLTLTNASDMQHNLLVCRPGRDVHMTVAQQAWAMPDALEREYVPESRLVIAHTRLVQPGGSDTIRFVAPKQPGAYPYVCTVPGHAQTMWGVMHVVAAGSLPAAGDVPAKPQAAEGTAAAHDHPAHAAAATGSPYLRNVTYQLFDGRWSKLPDFALLAPTEVGRVASGMVDLPITGKRDNFGVVFKANLDVPADGEYAFIVRSDDGARVRVDGKDAVVHDGLHPASMRIGKPVGLTKGPHVLEVAYFNATGDLSLQVAFRGPGIDGIAALSSDGARLDLDRYLLAAKDEPLVQRALLPDASTRSIAVGLPGGVNYCFDTTTCSVRYGWTGDFIDVGPQHGYGDGRGGSTVSLLGERFSVGAVDAQPLRIGGSDKTPTVAFVGYTRRGIEPPRFHYTVDGKRVTQTVEAAAEGKGLRFTYAFEDTPGAPVAFVVGEGAAATSSAGEAKGGVVEIAPAEAQQFTVTVVPSEVSR